MNISTTAWCANLYVEFVVCASAEELESARKRLTGSGPQRANVCIAAVGIYMLVHEYGKSGSMQKESRTTSYTGVPVIGQPTT